MSEFINLDIFLVINLFVGGLKTQMMAAGSRRDVSGENVTLLLTFLKK